jgi:hypothetical protein
MVVSMHMKTFMIRFKKFVCAILAERDKEVGTNVSGQAVKRSSIHYALLLSRRLLFLIVSWLILL